MWLSRYVCICVYVCVYVCVRARVQMLPSLCGVFLSTAITTVTVLVLHHSLVVPYRTTDAV